MGVEGTAGTDEVALPVGGGGAAPEVSARLDSVVFRDRSSGWASRFPGIAQPLLHMMEKPARHAGGPRPAGGDARAGGGLRLTGSLRPQDGHDPQDALAARGAPFDIQVRDPFLSGTLGWVVEWATHLHG